MKYNEDSVVVGSLVQNKENVNESPETTALLLHLVISVHQPKNECTSKLKV